MPIHMAAPAEGAPYPDCSENVSHRNAPGAISAMALLVSPVKPRVAFIVPGPEGSEEPGVSAATDTLLSTGLRIRASNGVLTARLHGGHETMRQPREIK